MLQKLKDMMGIRSTPEDVGSDPNLANTRRTGGADRDDVDSASTTGTGDSGEFVGEIAGQDPGFDEETGAEVRARKQDG